MNEQNEEFEIFENEKYQYKNLRFSNIPTLEQREFLKNKGWRYTKQFGGVWYPWSHEAKQNNETDINEFVQSFYPKKEKQDIITQMIDTITDNKLNEEQLKNVSEQIKGTIVNEKIIEMQAIIDDLKAKLQEQQSKISEREKKLQEPSRDGSEHKFVDGNLYPNDVNSAKTKLGDIVRETFLTLTDDEKEAGTTTEQKNTRYEKWYRPMIDEIMAAVTAGDQDLIKKINDFDLKKASHKEGNSYYSEDKAFKRDVNYKLLPELYEIVQDKIRKEYDEKKIPYIVMFSSESPKFPSENKVYTVKEFNELLLKADSEFHNRREYAEKKYGSADNYWELENEGKLPEEDKGIQFGYDKTNFKFFNIPNPANPEDSFSYEPSRYDIGDGNGSVFDYVRSTCSHDEFIEALNQLEKDLYFPEVTKTQREDIDKLVAKEAKKLSENLTEKMAAVDEAQEEYKELHKKWLIESSEAEAADKKLEDALSGVKAVYDKAMSDAFGKILNEYPYASIKSIEDSQLLQYAANEVKKMAVNELYLPSRNAQKAMNAEDYASYNSTDWAKLRKIWALFPANVNMTEYVGQKLEKLCKENGIELNENVVSSSTLEPSQEEISNARKLVRDTQAEIAKKKYESEQGSNYDSNLSTTDIAKKLRDYVKKNYPDYKFSITSKYFSGGSEINVTLKQAPGEITNENIMKEYLEHNSAREWWNKDTGKYEKYYEMTDERKKEVIKDSVDSAYVFNIPSTEENPSWMSPEVNKVMMDVQRELESYNFDHSDSQLDYYNVNFWSHYDISKEAVERSLKITKAPEKSLNFVLDKLSAAGIEVVQDKAEFDRILESEKILQKMAEDFSEFEKLSEELNTQKSKSQELENKKKSLEERKVEAEKQHLEDLALFAEKISKYLPVEESPYNKRTYYRGVNHINNKILVAEDKEHKGNYSWYLANIEGRMVFVHNDNASDAIITEIRDYDEIKRYSASKDIFNENILEEIQNNLKTMLEQNITLEKQKQNRLVNEVGNIKTDLLKASLKNESIEADFARLDNSLRFNANFEIESSELAEEVSVFPGSTGKSGLGIRHIIEERAKKDSLSTDEITALCGLILDTVRFGKITRDGDNRCELSKNGIIAIVRKDFDNIQKNWILTGFNYTGEDEEKNREATETIKTVIAKYSNSDGYSYFRSQVGAVIASLDSNISQSSDKSSPQLMVQNGKTYGFAYEGKIYLNPEIASSEVALHEYTHLWDNYTQRTNPELWQKGKAIFKNTHFWNDVKSDSNYADIADNEDLLLSEIHAQICGKMADAILTKIAERDGELTKDTVIDWDKETWEYLEQKIWFEYNHEFSPTDLKEFLSMPMKDFMNGVKITELINLNIDKELQSKMKQLYNKSFEDEYIVNKSKEFRYALLNRLQSDCNSYNSNNNQKLWAENPEEQIKDMISLYSSFEENEYPEWLSPEQLNMLSIKLTEKDINQIIEEAQKRQKLKMQRDEQFGFTGNEGLISESQEKTTEQKPYNFFINDAANLDLGIGAEIEPITGLSAEEAAVKYAELKSKGLSPYIGINIPGDFIFDDKEGQGAGIFTETNGHPSFYMGDNFVKELKKNDEHAQNVLAAYKELYEMTDKYIMGVEKPEFLFAKLEEFNQMGVAEPTFNIGGHTYTQKQIEEELREDIQNIFEELSPKPRIDGIRLYQNPEKNNKINILVQYDTEPGEDKWREDSLFNLIAEENILFNGMEVDVNPITPEKSGTIEEYLEHLERLGATSEAEAIEKQAELLDEHEPPLTVYTFSPFGYEGSLVTVETDLRRGIPAYDIVGIADSTVKESRERIRAAFKNSGLELPAERILQSLSPADLRKDSPMDVAMAVDILARKEDWRGEPVLALGELELSGNIRPTRGAHAAVTTARAAGISNIICDKTTAELLKDIQGIKILAVENLKEISEKINDKANFIETKPEVKKENEIEFNEDYFDAAKESLANYDLKGHFDSIRAIEIAVAGKHNILQVGAPGCGKTLLQQNLIPALTPKLTEEESKSIARINSIAGLDSPNRDKLVAPFRMPHQTASIEGIWGGGPNCRPGEISLAHKGTLFLDEAAEFRSSVLQMLRVPLETKTITLSRAGRTTMYPADFQLAIATNPCPCGCYGSKDKICLDSARSIDLYWKKFSDPLIDRIEIKNFVQRDEKDERTISLEEMREQVRKAYKIQRKRGIYNSHMTPKQIDEYCKLSDPCEKYVNGIEDLSPRSRANLLKLSLTIANMDGREEICINDLKEARELSAPVFDKPNKFKYSPNKTVVIGDKQMELFNDDENITGEHLSDAKNEKNRILEAILNDEKTDVVSTWIPRIDEHLFPVKDKSKKTQKREDIGMEM